jgi:Anp1
LGERNSDAQNMRARIIVKYIKILAIFLIIPALYFIIILDLQINDELLENYPLKTTVNNSDTTKIVYQVKPTINSAVLFLGVIAGVESFGDSRTFDDMLDLIISQFSDKVADYTLALLVSSQELFDLISSSLIDSDNQAGFSRITLIFDHNKPTERTHDRQRQKERRRFIAALRNTLVYSSMRDEDYHFWIDSDIIKIPEGLLDSMIESDKDIITPACKSEGFRDYDG